MQKLKKVRDALLRVTDNVSHYEAIKKVDKYIVWAEDNEPKALNADNKKIDQVIEGTIDYFTREEYDQMALRIQEELESSNICYRLQSVQYEEDTGFIHYEWTWQL